MGKSKKPICKNCGMPWPQWDYATEATNADGTLTWKCIRCWHANKRYPSESEEQIAFISAVRVLYPRLVIYHNPNGGKRKIVTGVRLKREGSLAGVPDIFCARARGGQHGLYLEMKSRNPSARLTPKQKTIIALLRNEDYAVEVCRGFEAALKCLADYVAQGRCEAIRNTGEEEAL